jgi:DNA-binding NarL/FixJ family response regulator
MTRVGETGQIGSRVDADWDRDPSRRSDDFCGGGQSWADPRPGRQVPSSVEMVARKLRRILAPAENVDVVAIATDAADDVERALRERPHVIITDDRFPEAPGAAATDMRSRDAATTILVVIASDQLDVLDAALGAGISQDVEETTAFDRLLDPERSPIPGNRNLRPLRAVSPGRRDHVASLTRRQTEVLRIMAEGLSDQAIADRLTLSLNTIRTHVQTILRKLGAHSKLEAVALANRRRLVD